jgi:hypothetical protein
MEQNMCQFWSFPKEIEYSSENKVNFLFLLNFFMFTFHFWILAKHNLTFFMPLQIC